MSAVRNLALAACVAGVLGGTAVYAQQPPIPPVPPAPFGGGFGGPGGGGNRFIWRVGENMAEQHRLQQQAGELARQFSKSEKEDEKRELRKKLGDVLSQ